MLDNSIFNDTLQNYFYSIILSVKTLSLSMLTWGNTRLSKTLTQRVTSPLLGGNFFYECADRFAPELLAGAMKDYWRSPIVLGSAENELWTEVAGLFRANDVDGRGSRTSRLPGDRRILSPVRLHQ